MKTLLLCSLLITSALSFASDVKTKNADDTVTVVVRGYDIGDCNHNQKNMVNKLEKAQKVVIELTACTYSNYYYHSEVKYLKY